MKKEFRVKKNRDFQTAFEKGKSFANRQFVVYLLKKEGQAHFRIGLSVSKKLGNAVVRNQIKRYIRQSFLELEDHLKHEYDFIVIARKPVAAMDFHEARASLIHVLKVSRVLDRHFSIEKQQNNQISQMKEKNEK